MRILLTNGHSLYQEGLRLLLENLDTPVSVVESGDFGEAGRLLAKDNNFDLAIIEMDLVRNANLHSLADLVQIAPTVPFVALSTDADASAVQRVLDVGMVGVIDKRERAPVILHALRTVLAGGIYTPPH